MDRIDFVKGRVRASIELKQAILEDDALLQIIADVSELCLQAYKNGNKLLLAGNGGSAADSQHIAAEFVSRFEMDRPGLPALALTTDTSVLTAIGNDYGYEQLFARQIQANAVSGDIFIGISTSGNSPNILAAIGAAKEKGVKTVGLAGSGGAIQDVCDHCISVPSTSTPTIQESHIMIGHIICAYVDKAYFSSERQE
jgi:D-sedoheptulose 7-phosphate isomerase